MAIHDLHYSTPAPDWCALGARLQLLAEMRVGSLVRKAEAEEDAAFVAAREAAT